jgi:hypothetical protein
MGDMRNAYGSLVRKSELNRSLGRIRYRWGSNIKMDLGGIRMGIFGLDSNGSGYRPVAGSFKYYNEPWLF